jgi:spermidine synthase
MCLEMMAFRVLTPNFGGDIYVSGSIIGVFMAALSLGYYSGGRVADRFPRVELLAALILAAGLFAVAVNTLKEPYLGVTQEWIADRRWGACAYALLLYGPSTILLGMVSPFAVRLSARHMADMGKVSGRLYALSTFGSIFGTLFPSFYWIAWWPVSRITETTGWALVALGVIMATVARLRCEKPPVRAVFEEREIKARESLSLRCLLPLGLGLALLPSAAWAQDRVIYQKDSLYHRVVVTENERWRTLKFDRHGQSGMLLKDPLRSEFRYTDGFHLAKAYQPKIRRVLFIGMGAATGPKQFRKFYPDVEVEAVEIDPEVVAVAKRFFHFAPDAKTKVHVADGRVFLNGARGSYDAILVDAYYAEAIPFHLTTVEFMRLLKRRLAPGGVALFNVIGSLEGRGSRLMRSEWKTVSRVFPTCAIHPVPDEGETARSVSRERIRNVMLVATDTPALSRNEVIRRAASLKNARTPFLSSIAAALVTTSLQVADVPILSDDYAPVNNLVPVQ